MSLNHINASFAMMLRRSQGYYCAYPLDDDGTVAALFGEEWLPAIAPEYQSFTHNHTTANNTFIASRNISAALSYASCKDLVVGRNTAAQFNITSCSSGYTGFASLIVYKVDAGDVMTGFVRVGTEGATGSLTAVEQVNNGPYLTIGTVSGPRDGAIAIYVNGTTGEVGWTVNGTDIGYVSGFTVAVGERFGLAIAIDDRDFDVGSISGVLAVQAPLITEPIPGVAEDMCGALVA